MDTFLTLVIAVGGIATGIGAIWTAMLARRQLNEQRQFLKEQTEIAKRQAELTEQSLAQTERSVSEQVQTLREQNERSRLNLELDLLIRLGERFVSPHLRSSRRAAAKYLSDNAFVKDDVVEVEHLNRATYDVVDFFEEVGHLQRIGALQAQSVWNTFGVFAQTYWLLCKPALEKMREEHKDPALYEEFEYLSGVLADIDRSRGIESYEQARVRQTLEYEALLGEEPPTATD
jgi:hypothetical protein